MMTVSDIRNQFLGMYKNEMFVIDKSGVKTLEIIGASFIADEESIFGELNQKYAEAEIEWYESQSLNVNDIAKYYHIVPKIWKQVADENGMINSNYGFCAFSSLNGNQWDNVIKALKNNANTRQAIFIFNRPSMHIDAYDLGKSDFMCFQNIHVFIRNNKLEMIVCSRSTDGVFGYLNDNYFVKYLQIKLHEELSDIYQYLQLGNIQFNVGSIHIYEQHFKLLENEND